MKKYLLPKHEETTKGAILDSIETQIEELKKQNPDNQQIFQLEKVRWLNDHGPRHIDTVIKRAGQLLNTRMQFLTDREVFFMVGQAMSKK